MWVVTFLRNYPSKSKKIERKFPCAKEENAIFCKFDDLGNGTFRGLYRLLAVARQRAQFVVGVYRNILIIYTTDGVDQNGKGIPLSKD